MRGFHPDMSDALQPDPLAYGSFNEFFTRALRPGARPMDTSDSALISPVDGPSVRSGDSMAHSYYRPKDTIIHWKRCWIVPARKQTGRRASSADVLATLYLAPFNYHRIHMPLSGTLRAAWYVPGALFSVNAVTAGAVPGLFARNERVVCIFEDGPRLFAMVLVGALFVGSMDTVWHGEITPRSPRTRLQLPLDESRAAITPRKRGRNGSFQHGVDSDSHPAARHD